MNQLRVRDLFDIAKEYLGVKDKKTRKATQSDIDAFYAR